MTDEQWIQRTLEGDLSAFEALMTTYQNRVYGLCLRMCGHREDAFDLSQEIFLRVFRSLHGFKGDASFSTWLYRLAINVCLDHLRKTLKARTLLRMEREAEDISDIPDDHFSPERAWEGTELREAIAAALTKLTPEHRAVVILRDIQQCSYAEISEILDCEEGTVKSRLFRAREALRRELTARGNFFEERTSK